MAMPQEGRVALRAQYHGRHMPPIAQKRQQVELSREQQVVDVRSRHFAVDPMPVHFPSWTGEFARMCTTPRQNCGVSVSKAGVRAVVRRRCDFADRQLHRADVSNSGNRCSDADAEIDIELPGCIRRVAIDKDVLAVQLDAARSRRINLVQIALEFRADPARREARAHCRDGSRCGALQRHRILARRIHAN